MYSGGWNKLFEAIETNPSVAYIRFTNTLLREAMDFRISTSIHEPRFAPRKFRVSFLKKAHANKYVPKMENAAQKIQRPIYYVRLENNRPGIA